MKTTIPHRFTLALQVLIPLSFSAWIATIAAIYARDPLPTDAADIALMAVNLTSAMTAMTLAVVKPRTGKLFAILPALAGLYGFWFGPSILWKLQLPLMLAIWAASYAEKHLIDDEDDIADAPSTLRLRPLMDELTQQRDVTMLEHDV